MQGDSQGAADDALSKGQNSVHPLGIAQRRSHVKALAAVLTMSVLLVLGGSGIAVADPQIVTITSTCDGGVTVTVTTILNNEADVAFVDGTVAGGSTSVAIVEAASTNTGLILKALPTGFSQNGVPLTTCTFILPFAPQLGTITAQILFTPVGSH